jgi:hypothetical protein
MRAVCIVIGFLLLCGLLMAIAQLIIPVIALYLIAKMTS